ncbi:MAG: hypothetical protein IAG10_23235 [Planctomycetaceae bacterium]|nr:hypothetical protein [Planctomycetaceae bacterium]
MARWIVLLLLAMMFTSLPVLADEKLDKARSEVRDSSSKSASSKQNSDDSDSNSECDSESSILGSFVGSLLSSLFSNDSENAIVSESADGGSSFTVGGNAIISGLTAPWWIPRSLVGDKDEVLLLADYPYAGGWDGYFVNQDPEPDWTKRWSGRFLVESGTDFDGLQKHGGRLRLDTTSRFGLDTEWNFRRESLSPGHDTLWNGDVNLVYRFAQSQRAAFYTGLGVNWLSDRFGSDAGFNFTYGADFYPAKPWVLSGSIDWGTLGHASAFHGRATVGVMLNRLEVFTGYDYYKLGSTSLPSFVAGVQLHF